MGPHRSYESHEKATRRIILAGTEDRWSVWFCGSRRKNRRMDTKVDITINCLSCTASITVPATDRHSVAELLGDFGWQATREGAYCGTHKIPTH